MKHVSPDALEGAFILKDSGTGDPAAVVIKALDDLRTSVEGRLKAVETKGADAALVSRLDQLEARLNRPGAAAADKHADTERKAFIEFARRGIEGMAPELKTALTVGTDATAGYLAPPTFAPELIKKLVQFSPIRQYARVVTIGGAGVKYPRRLTSTTATWTDEVAARTASNPSYEQIGITPHELATYVDVSNQLLEDAMFNIEAELAADLGEAFGKTEGTAFVSGDGNGKPFGILNAAGIAVVKTGVADGFPTATSPADVIIGAFHALPATYANAGVWIMNRKTLGILRTWKDATGRFLLVDPLTQGAPATILGRPVVEAPDMPDVAADASPIVFGDLSGFRIVDRVGFALLRDPFTQAATGMTRFHARKRVGADVTHPDRFLKITCAV